MCKASTALGLFVAAITLRVTVSIAVAQPQTSRDTFEDPRTMSRDNGDGDSKARIPITMPNNTEVLGGEAIGLSTPTPVAPLEEPIDPNSYVCGAGDVLEISFWGKQNFRLRIGVDLEGRTFVSKVGFVQVAGKTLTAVREQIRKKVRANYPGLQFDVILVTPRTFQVHVADNVKQPGMYVSNPLERVSALLARAGGVSGSRRRISIHRKPSGELTADLLLYEQTGDVRYNPRLMDGDVVTVPFPEVSVSISGAVRRPRAYELVQTKDLAELLKLAGGFTSSVAKNVPIRIVRRNEQQQARFIDVTFSNGNAPNIALQDEDVVHVQSADEMQRSVAVIGGSMEGDKEGAIKRLPFVEGDTVRSLIDRVGGLSTSGDLQRSYISRPRKNADPEIIALDLDALFVRREVTADRKLQFGDSIVIPPLRYNVLVEGAVLRSGLYPYNPKFGVGEYIALAGGRSRVARGLESVELIDQNGRKRAYRQGLRIAPGEAIVVPERSFSRSEIAQLVLAGAGLLISGVAITFAVTR